MNSQMIFMDPKIEQVNGYFPNLYDLKIRSNGEEVIGTMLTPGKKVLVQLQFYYMDFQDMKIIMTQPIALDDVV